MSQKLLQKAPGPQNGLALPACRAIHRPIKCIQGRRRALVSPPAFIASSFPLSPFATLVHYPLSPLGLPFRCKSINFESDILGTPDGGTVARQLTKENTDRIKKKKTGIEAATFHDPRILLLMSCISHTGEYLCPQFASKHAKSDAKSVSHQKLSEAVELCKAAAADTRTFQSVPDLLG